MKIENEEKLAEGYKYFKELSASDYHDIPSDLPREQNVNIATPWLYILEPNSQRAKIGYFYKFYFYEKKGSFWNVFKRKRNRVYKQKLYATTEGIRYINDKRYEYRELVGFGDSFNENIYDYMWKPIED